MWLPNTGAWMYSQLCDYLSCLKLQELNQIKPTDTQLQSTTPSCLVWPVSDFMWNIWSLQLTEKNMHNVYNRALDIFMSHQQLYGQSLLALREFDFVEFIAFLSMAGLAPATILSYISGVRYHLRIRFLNNFQDSFSLNWQPKASPERWLVGCKTTDYHEHFN